MLSAISTSNPNPEAAMADMSAEVFAEWLSTAKRRQRIAYFVGHLAAERLTTLRFDGKVIIAPVPLIDDLAEATYKAYEDGLVDLVQVKLGPGCWSYIAIRRRVK